MTAAAISRREFLAREGRVNWRRRIEFYTSSAKNPSASATSSGGTPTEVQNSEFKVGVKSDEVENERSDKDEPEGPEEDSLFVNSEPDAESSNCEPKNHCPPEVDPDDYAPENPGNYDLTDADLEFFDRPYNTNRDHLNEGRSIENEGTTDKHDEGRGIAENDTLLSSSATTTVVGSEGSCSDDGES